MPRAVVSTQTERHPLKSCPGDGSEEPGFVELKRLSYGQKLERMAMTSKMKVTAEAEETKGSRAERRAKVRQSGLTGEVEMLQLNATLFSFRHCVVNHNLFDEQGNKLDLTNPRHVQDLDPKVGEEIDTLIDDMNNFEEDDEDTGNSPGASVQQ